MRNRIDLCGEWDFRPLYGVEGDISLPETEGRFEKITVPSLWRSNWFEYRGYNPYDVMDYPKEWNAADTGMFRRFFDVSRKEDEAVYLNIEAAAQRSGIYVNGRFVCEWDEEFLPLNVDITEYVRDGENELRIVCTSFEKCTIPSGQIKTTGVRGSGFGEVARGIWDDIYIETASKDNIRDCYIRTSVRNRRIDITAELSQKADGCSVIADIIDAGGGDPVLTLRGDAEEGKCELSGAWNDPVLWDTENPHLYYARLRLIKDGAAVDEKTERFGFREIWCEGPRFMLNGIPVNLRGDSWHFKATVQMTKEYALNWYEMCRSKGVNYIRLHANPHPRFYLDAADEAGMLIVDETAIYGSGKSMDASHPQYIQRCRDHARRLVLRDRNHPCVVFWSLQNEMRWVDGRDTFKLYIPELMKIMNDADPTRLVSLDGDNRLISYENTQIESLHYNIDGTIEQWRREKPLTIGEHGGMWYICPQNASQYVGYPAYEDFEPCAIGFAKKERLFLEYARRLGVPGLSTFHFSYYFNYSMPDEDIYPGTGPTKRIPKNSLTINNGLLPEKYPRNRENPLMPFMQEAFKAVTVINREYDSSFYGDVPLTRTFDVYNDTLHSHETTVKYEFTVNGVKTAGEERFTQPPADDHILELTFDPGDITAKTEAELTLRLYHENELMHERKWEYRFYPRTIQKDSIRTSRKAFYIGNVECFERVRALLPGISRIGSVSEADEGSVLVFGNRLDLSPDEVQKETGEFAARGGSVVFLEQNTFALGNLSLVKQDFFSAYTGNHSHPILKGLSDDDLIFWGPSVHEDRPEALIHSNFAKPQSGEYTFVLESGAGDYADGGDLWTPLMTMKHGKGSVVFCQIEINENYERVPQAAVLLRNILEYAENAGYTAYRKVYAADERSGEMLDELNVSRVYDLGEADIAVADPATADTESLKTFLFNGGTLLTLPFGETGAEKLSAISGEDIRAGSCEVSHLQPVSDDSSVCSISPFDLYRYDKVVMSPRLVENKRIAFNRIECSNAQPILMDVPGTPWEDYHWHKIKTEMAIIPLVSINREHPKEKDTFFACLRSGKGRIFLSQLKYEKGDEKDIRVWSRILENLGAEVKTGVFDYARGIPEISVGYFMTLPIEPWQDYSHAKEYYTDPDFSLNNLGEGLYGWMKKLEKNRQDGFIYIPDSAKRQYFLTCFAYKETEGEVRAVLDCNYPACLYVNGDKVTGEKVLMRSGDNRIVVETASEQDELRFRLVFTDDAGRPVEDLRTHLTIDEVDPK